ncbi:hypothetical protein [Kozakia baliensis]|uniref:hypothetical protein n=1 Tax=Kozakia baliensis TaxID=153496 RepID=UPI001362A029|nr:hypothetical protein [Kozakia baliensis]
MKPRGTNFYWFVVGGCGAFAGSVDEGVFIGTEGAAPGVVGTVVVGAFGIAGIAPGAVGAVGTAFGAALGAVAGTGV